MGATENESTWRDEMRQLLTLAGPVILAHVGMVTMGLVDTAMVGRVSGDALAGIALGNVYSFTLLGFGMGVITAVDPLVAQAMGARDEPAVARALQRGAVITLALSVPTALLTLCAGPVLETLRQPEAAVPLAAAYARVTAAAVPAFLLYILLRQTLQAMHRTGALLVAVVAANVANVVLNWALIWGHLGLPALGPVGSAWSTMLCRWVLVLGILAVDWSALRPHAMPFQRSALQWAPLARMVMLGLPIGLQYLVEMSTFGAVALLIGLVGTTEVAGHQVALNLAACTFMVPLGVSAAAAVRVGHGIGRGDARGARRAAALALGLGGGIMAVMGVGFAILARPLALAFTTDETVVHVATLLIRIAAVFQVFDGTQVVCIGILRGTGDTRTPIIANLVGFYGLALPVSLVLGFALRAGAEGLWWGLVVGLAVVATALLLRVKHRMSSPLARVEVEAAPREAVAG
jgi:MATE family multidrug resistance protein